MEKNPSKYGGLSNTEIQKQLEIMETKTQIIQLANSKVEGYPKKEQTALIDTAKHVVEETFSEIKPINIKVNRELFFNLPKRIEAALEKRNCCK